MIGMLTSSTNIIIYKLVYPNSVFLSNIIYIYRGHKKARLSGCLEEAKDLTGKATITRRVP